MELCIQMEIFFFFFSAFHFFSQLFVRPPKTTVLPFCIAFSWGCLWSLPPVQCYIVVALYNCHCNSVHSSSGSLSASLFTMVTAPCTIVFVQRQFCTTLLYFVQLCCTFVQLCTVIPCTALYNCHCTVCKFVTSVIVNLSIVLHRVQLSLHNNFVIATLLQLSLRLCGCNFVELSLHLVHLSLYIFVQLYNFDSL